MPIVNTTEFPNTPKTIGEFKQAEYVMCLWILQYEMGLTLEDAQILLWAHRGEEEFERLLNNHGISENDEDYVGKLRILEYYHDVLEDRYGTELRKRSKRFDTNTMDLDVQFCIDTEGDFI